MNNRLKFLLFNTMLAGGIATGGTGCSPKNANSGDPAPTKSEISAAPSNTNVAVQTPVDSLDNATLFRLSCNKIKFAITFVENYYPYVFWDGKVWTAGYGLTWLYDERGVATRVTAKTKPLSMAEADTYQGRYLNYAVLPDIDKYITVSMDEKTLIATCVFRYCVGGSAFRKSEYLKQLNAGATGAELARYLTGFKRQRGLPKRFYFFAAMMAGEMQCSELLDLYACGCYNLTWDDIFKRGARGAFQRDSRGFMFWDFSKLQQNLAKAKRSKSATLQLANNETVVIQSRLMKDAVLDYIWQDVLSYQNFDIDSMTGDVASWQPLNQNSCTPPRTLNYIMMNVCMQNQKSK